MNKLRTFGRLTQKERALFARAFLIVAGVRVGLWVVSFQRMQQMIDSRSQDETGYYNGVPISRLVWAVQAASKRIPAATCLTQSLALHYLLTSAGYSSQIRIGIKKEANKSLYSHAWVEFEGEPLLSSNNEVEPYTQVLAVGGTSA